LSEAFGEEIDDAFLVEGHLTRAFLRNANFDLQLAARLDHKYVRPGPRKIKGYSRVPDGIYPFNGHLEGFPFGVPKLGSLNPGWAKYVAYVPTILGRNWRTRLENLLFDLNDNVPLMYRYADTVGPDVKNYLSK